MIILDVVFTGKTMCMLLPCYLLARPFIFSWKSTQPALLHCVALGALKNFQKFMGKQILSFDKLANYRLAALLKRLQHRCSNVNFYEISMNSFFCFCNKTSTETSFKNDCRWVPWFEHRRNSFTSICSIKLFFLSSRNLSLYMAFRLLLKYT